MVALRILGLVILGSFVFSIGTLGYFGIRAVMRDRDAKQALMNVDEAIQTVISTGNPQTVTVRIPDGYTMSFTGYWVSVDGSWAPEAGYALPFYYASPTLGAGEHRISITLENFSIVVREIPQ